MFRADRVPRSKVAEQTNGFFLHCRCIERCSDLRQRGAPLIPAFLPHYVKGDCFQQTGRGQSFWQLVQKIGIVRPGSKSSARAWGAQEFPGGTIRSRTLRYQRGFSMVASPTGFEPVLPP